jgi:uncharacterized membrane protein
MSDKETQGVPGVGFLVMAFTDEKAGDQALHAMKKAMKEKTFYFENAAVIRQGSDGKVHYQETGDMKTGKGAGVGALIGGIVGILGGPPGVALGASAGAAIGAGAAHRDAGFRDESLKTVGLALKPETSAVVAITSEDFLKAVQKQVPLEDIRRFVGNLSAEISSKLDGGKSVAIGLLLVEDGLAFKEVALDESSAEVMVLAVTQDAALAAAAVVTADELDYQVVGATKEGAFIEAGVVTKDAALIVDDVVDQESEALMVTAVLPEEQAKKLLEETGEREAKSAEAESAESDTAET